MMASRFFPALLMTPAYPLMSEKTSRIFASSLGGISCACKLSRRMISFIPMTALIGVRISWLMFARNSLLAALERSATRRASRRTLFSAAF